MNKTFDSEWRQVSHTPLPLPCPQMRDVGTWRIRRMAHLLVPFAVRKDLASLRGCPECQNSLGSFHRFSICDLEAGSHHIFSGNDWPAGKVILRKAKIFCSNQVEGRSEGQEEKGTWEEKGKKKTCERQTHFSKKPLSSSRPARHCRHIWAG